VSFRITTSTSGGLVVFVERLIAPTASVLRATLPVPHTHPVSTSHLPLRHLVTAPSVPRTHAANTSYPPIVASYPLRRYLVGTSYPLRISSYPPNRYPSPTVSPLTHPAATSHRSAPRASFQVTTLANLRNFQIK